MMQVKATIVSGVGFSSLEENEIDLSQAGVHSNDIHAGSFDLLSAPGIDVDIHLEGSPVLINEDGKAIHMDQLSIFRENSKSGNQHISINGNIPAQDDVSGRYNGAVTAVIEHL